MTWWLRPLVLEPVDPDFSKSIYPDNQPQCHHPNTRSRWHYRHGFRESQPEKMQLIESLVANDAAEWERYYRDNDGVAGRRADGEYYGWSCPACKRWVDDIANGRLLRRYMRRWRFITGYWTAHHMSRLGFNYADRSILLQVKVGDYLEIEMVSHHCRKTPVNDKSQHTSQREIDVIAGGEAFADAKDDNRLAGQIGDYWYKERRI